MSLIERPAHRMVSGVYNSVPRTSRFVSRKQEPDRYVQPKEESDRAENRNRKWMLIGLAVASGVLALVALFTILRKRGGDDDPFDDDLKGEPLDKVELSWIEFSRFVDELGKEDEWMRDKLRGVGDDLARPQIVSRKDLYEMTARYLRHEDDLLKIGQALAVFLAAFNRSNSSRKVDAVNAALAMQRRDFGWAEIWLSTSNSKGRDGIDFTEENKVPVGSETVVQRITKWKYGEYFIEDLIAALVRGILNLQCGIESEGERKERSLRAAYIDAMSVIKFVRKDNQKHSILTRLAETIIGRANSEAEYIWADIADQNTVTESVFHVVRDLTGVKLPPPPLDPVHEKEEVEENKEPEDELSDSARLLINSIASKISDQTSLLEVTQLTLTHISDYWEESAAHGKIASNALESVIEGDAEAMADFSNKLRLELKDRDLIENGHELEVIHFFHDLARAGMYFEASRVIKDPTKQVVWFSNIATTSLNRCYELGLPCELCEYVKRFHRSIRAENDRISDDDSNDNGDESNGASGSNEPVGRRQTRPTGILRSSVDISGPTYTNTRLNRTEIYKWAAYLLYPSIARFRPA